MKKKNVRNIIIDSMSDQLIIVFDRGEGVYFDMRAYCVLSKFDRQKVEEIIKRYPFVVTAKPDGLWLEFTL